ncbi:murein hydrolase activator EnvC family protein [Marinobacterium rhizophilum]|uniref:murein hydrolase activator EnvC family protein n=1 Tax=Marinobacterium rhizophilum TaxID=420402 RepID=UPI000378B30D|nr:peptidoglycan DD-metalloendopeptidase family protein [Marinobacterium rhizophilum]
MMRILMVLLLILQGNLLMAADKQATEAQIQRLQKDIGALQSSIRTQQGERKSLQQALRDSEAEIGQLGNQLADLEQKLAQLGSRAGDLEQRRDALRASLAASTDQLQRQLRKQYRLGNQPRLQVLFNQRDPAQIDRMLHYFDLINGELVAQLTLYQQQLAGLESTELALDETQSELLVRRNELKARQQRLDAARAERKATLAMLAKSIDSKQGRLKSLDADRRQLESVLVKIEKALKEAKMAREARSLPQLKGKLSWPVDGRLVRAFGNTDSGVSYDGMLIAAQTGREVRAVHRGRVVFSDWLRGYGLLLIIDHGGGYMSLYGHNQRLLKEPGAWVDAGDAVATVGNSGGYTEPSLYFAVRFNGKPTDPARWLAGR